MSEKTTNQILFEIFKKAEYINNVERILREGSVSNLLNEELKAADVDTVRSAIKDSSEQVKQLAAYLVSLEQKGFDLNKMRTVTDHVSALRKALETAEKELAGVSFQAGAISTFMGQKLTLPQITQSAIAIQSKASDMAGGLSRAIQRIIDNLAPLAKSPQVKELPISDLLGQQGMPPKEKIEKGLHTAINKSMGGGFFGQLKSFFGQAVSGEMKTIMKQIPPLDTNKAAKEMTDALMGISIGALTDEKPPPVPKSSSIPDLTKVAKIIKDETPKGASAKKQQAAEPTKSEEPTTGAPTADPAKAPPPLPPEEGKKEQAKVEKQIKTAVKSVVSKKNQSPKVAALKAIDTWTKSLSKTSQAELAASNRLKDLKLTVDMALDDSAKAVEGEVSAAVQAWRDDHEAQLVKNNRFSKKNFDSLQDLIPKLAAAMMKTKKESRQTIRPETIRKAVFSFLNRKFYPDTPRVLKENVYDEEDMILYRMNKLAGFKDG